MGVFWHAAVFKKQDTIDVQALVRQLAEGENEFDILPDECGFAECEGGTAVVLNDFCRAFDGLAKVLSQKLEGPVLVCDIYDDDFWDYYLYKEGRELDKFSTVPDCLEAIPDEEWEHWRGNAELLAEEFGCPAEPLSEYLQFWGEDNWSDPWEVWDFLKALGFALPEDDEDFQDDTDDDEPVDRPYLVIPQETGGTRRDLSDAPRIIRTSNAEFPIDLVADVSVDMDLMQWVRICEENGEMQTFPGSALTSEQTVRLMDETLKGRYTYLAADFLLQGEGIYVKRLGKKVYRPFHSTVVLHQGEGKMACIFFAGDSMCCYELIGDFEAYDYIEMKELRQIPVGGAVLPEYAVFRERSGIDRALRMLFSDLESADKRLGKSSLWSADIAFPGGINNYNRRRRELGLLSD